IAQLESIVASASQQPPDPVLCFDLLSDLISAIGEEPKDSILLWQRKCEDALYSLLTLGARQPVRHLASVAMATIIHKGDSISIYSRASSLQGFLSDGKRGEPQRVAGASHCLGELYRHFGRRITSGLLETTMITTKLMKFSEEFVRLEALIMLQNALEGCGGSAASSAYNEAYRLITRSGIGDKSFLVRIAAARCLKAFANIGGPGLGITELDNSASYCVKAGALEDPVLSVRDAFAEAMGSLLALGMNPEAQVQLRGKGPFPPAKKLEDGLQRHLALPFTKASGARFKDIRIGITFSWVFFLQTIHLKYLHPDSELQDFALQAMQMLSTDASVDAHALLQSPNVSSSMKIAVLRTLAYILKTLGEVPNEFKEVLDDTVVAAVSHSSQLVRIEAALTLRALAEVDPTCVGGLISYGVTTLNALRENVSLEKGSNLKVELDSLHGQATVLAALVSISPKLPLGYPARLPRLVLEVSKKMLTESSRNPMAATGEKEAGWLLLSSLLASMPKEEIEDQVFDILSLWADLFSGNAEHEIKQTGDLTSRIYLWSVAIDALTAFVRCFISPKAVNSGILLQPVMYYLSRALSYISLLAVKILPNLKPAIDIFIIRTLIAYQSIPDPMAYKSDHPQILHLCTTPFRDWFEDELRAFQGGKDGLMPCVWVDDPSSFPQDRSGMLSLLELIEKCLKAGKKQTWHAASVTNICVGLLTGLKTLLALRPQPLGLEILNMAQAIFQNILAEGDTCASQRRASSEGLGLLARLGNDIFTARLVILQIWSLHGLLLTIEAAGLSVSHVQATLGLAMDILLSEENGWVDLLQGVGRLINAIVTVLGPELAPGSIFFSRCKSVVAEISSRQETATLLESVRFTQQLVLFAPQAVSVHSHVQTLLLTLSSGQPTLRHLAVSTLRHLIEKDPISIIDEQIEDSLFHMLDEETDSEIGNLVRTTIMRLLYASCPLCPSRWISLCRNMVLATSARRNAETGNYPSNGPDGDSRSNFGDDDENMVSTSKGTTVQVYSSEGSSRNSIRDKHLRNRTRVFAAECLSHLPTAVGKNPAHFDLSIARKHPAFGKAYGDWLVLHVQELISLAYQISTIQFENMQPLGVGLLSTIVDKAQLVSAVRTALDSSSGPILLEAGLHLATKIMTSGIISGDQAAVKRIFSLISHPLNDFKDLYYPSFAEWVSCKWKPFLDGIQSPLVSSKLKPCLEEVWPVILQALALDAVPVNPDGNTYSKFTVEKASTNSFISGYSMVELELEDYQFLWGFALLVLFEGKYSILTKQIIPLGSAKANYGGDTPLKETNPLGLKLYEIVLPVFQFLSTEKFFSEGFLTMDICLELLQVFAYSINMNCSWNSLAISVLSQIVQNCPENFLEAENFAFLVIELCLAYIFNIFHSSDASSPDHLNWDVLVSSLFITAKALVKRIECKKQLKSVVMAFLLIGYNCIKQASTELCFAKVNDFVKCTSPLLKKLRKLKEFYVVDTPKFGDGGMSQLKTIFGISLNVIAEMSKDCIKSFHGLENETSDLRKLLQLKLAFSLEQAILLAKVAHEIECPGDDSKAICFAVFKNCNRCIQAALNDSDVQVQAIGLQVLQSVLQRYNSLGDGSFWMFFLGELLPDIFIVIQRMLKISKTKESIVIAGECLRILMLLQTLSKASECQRGFMNLLLEAIVMVFSTSEHDFFLEVNDIRSTAMRLVSHLAQIPSSAGHLKDVLLSMPVTHRQQLQGVIRASVTQAHTAAQAKPTLPALGIKIPLPKEGRRDKDSAPIQSIEGSEGKDLTLLTTPGPSHKSSIEESEEDEDDWDAFKSFPASTTVAGTDFKLENVAEEPPLENSSTLVSNSDSKELAASQLLNNEKEINDPEHHETIEEEVSPVDKNDILELHDVQTDGAVNGKSNQLGERKEGVLPSQENEKDQVASQDNEKTWSEPVEEAEEQAELNLEEHEQRKERPETVLAEDAIVSAKVKMAEDHEQKKETPDDEFGQVSTNDSGDVPPVESSDNKLTGAADGKSDREQDVEADEDAEEKIVGEEKSSDQHEESRDSFGKR
ncbi:LOW QUALITY PROTEIN: hypothetical protein CFOL_v3_19131, partial [Cephalotus follicularis]